MVRIVKLLFATTLLSIFSYVLIFTSTTGAGNGGEYWGYNGTLSAVDAAKQSFDARDFRYLQVDITNSMGKRFRQVPMASRCRNHPLGQELVTRKSANESIHGYDSIKLATSFAEEFNNRMNSLLELEFNICCGDCAERGS
jgi:hypothetical protein